MKRKAPQPRKPKTVAVADPLELYHTSVALHEPVVISTPYALNQRANADLVEHLRFCARSTVCNISPQQAGLIADRLEAASAGVHSHDPATLRRFNEALTGRSNDSITVLPELLTLARDLRNAVTNIVNGQTEYQNGQRTLPPSNTAVRDCFDAIKLISRLNGHA